MGGDEEPGTANLRLGGCARCTGSRVGDERGLGVVIPWRTGARPWLSLSGGAKRSGERFLSVGGIRLGALEER